MKIPALNTSPFLRILPFFIFGIILQYSLHVSWRAGISALIFAILFSIGVRFFSVATQYRLKSFSNIVLQVGMIAAGMFCFYFNNQSIRKNWYGNALQPHSHLVLELTEPLSEKTKSYKAEANVVAVINNQHAKGTEGKLLLYFAKSDMVKSLKAGDRIVIPNVLQEIKNSGNPGAFDYKQYAAFHNTFHQAFIRDGSFYKTDSGRISRWNKMLLASRQKVLHVLQQYIAEKEATGVAQALLIGFKDNLDKELVQSYSNTGVVHIIAISGLHLGLIYVVLVWLCARIKYLNKHRLIKVLLILFGLWAFALLTGLPASVLRSAVMFSLVLIGQHYFTRPGIYNALAGSAFLMLIFNPYLLWDVGFQLSYLAVVGIIWLQPAINKWVYIPAKDYKKPKNWPHYLLKSTWSLITVSLAAQVFTLPMTLYYFHQFPLMFLLTNLIAVPLSTIILFGEILLLIVSFIMPLAAFIGMLLRHMITFLNEIIRWADTISFAKIDFIFANGITTILLFLILIFIAAALMKPSKQLAFAALSTYCLFVAIHIFYILKSKNESRFVVYNTGNMQAMDFIHHGKFMFYGDSSLSTAGMLQNFHLRPSRIAQRAYVQQDSARWLVAHGPWIQFANKKMLLLDGNNFLPPLEEKIDADVVILSHNNKIKLAHIAQCINANTVVADASNTRYKIEQWKKEANALALRFYPVSDSGAFVLNIP